MQDIKNEKEFQGENKEILIKIRENIDILDEEILHLLQKRAGLSKAVAHAKNGSISFRPEREKEIIERLYLLNNKQQTELPFTKDSMQELPLASDVIHELPSAKDGILQLPLAKEHIQTIWAEIFSYSRSLQKATSIAFLGPLGTFSHFASREVFGRASEFIPCADFAEVFESVYKRESHYGLVPIENSQQGSVGQCLDLFDTYPVAIIGEHYSNICQCLLSTETNLNDIVEIFSHPQALMQSGDWIKKHLPNACLTEMSSTAHAAKRAMHEKKTAVIGHEKLIHLTFDTDKNDDGNNHTLLNVLAKDIAKDKNNKTRFAIITSQDDMKAEFTKNYKAPKTSFTFSVPDKAGALSEILCLLQKASVSLSKLESRPLYQRIKYDTWQYRFFADANAHLSQETELVKEIRKICYDFRILGVYENNI